MIDIYSINIGDLIGIETVITPHENPEIGTVETKGGYYPVIYIYKEDETDLGQIFYTIGIEVSDNSILYITEEKEDIITDWIKK